MTVTDSVLRRRSLPRRVRRPLAGLAAGGAVVFVLVAVVVVLAVRWWDADGLQPVGVWALVGAVVLGMPHGALDIELLTTSRRQRAMVGLSYVSVAALIYLAWWSQPTLGVAALLVVSALHFGWADVVVNRWRDSAERSHAAGSFMVARGLATGALAVSGPFAWWPTQTGPLLGQLDVAPHAWLWFTLVSRWVFVLAGAAGLAGTGAAWASRDRLGALEPVAVAALTLVAPPLLGFAIFFAGWHAWRQSARLLAVHPASRPLIRRGETGPAIRYVARRAVLPTLLALATVGALAITGGQVPAPVLIALLAVSVPHAIVGLVVELPVFQARMSAIS